MVVIGWVAACVLVQSAGRAAAPVRPAAWAKKGWPLRRAEKDDLQHREELRRAFVDVVGVPLIDARKNTHEREPAADHAHT